MQPDRQVVAGHGLEHRQEFRRGDRFAVHVREDLNAPCPELVHSAVRFPHRRVRIVERQRGDESGEALRVTRDELRHAVVRRAGELERLGGGPHDLERWRRQRQDLLVVLEPIHDAKALVEVVEHRHAAAAFPDVLEIGSDLHQFL